MSPPEIEPAVLGFLVGHLTRLDIGTGENMCWKILQHSEVTDNALGVSRTRGNTVIIVINMYVLQQTAFRLQM